MQRLIPKKRFLPAAALAVFSTLALADCTLALPPDIARIKKNGKLVVALHSEDSPPFLYRDGSGQLKGIDIELSRLIAQQLEVDVVFSRNARNFDDLINCLAQNKADIAISALYPSPKRAQKARFTKPYYKTTPVLVVNRLRAAAVRLNLSFDDFNTTKTSIGFFDVALFPALVRQKFPLAGQKSFKNDLKRSVFIGELYRGLLTAAYIDEIEEKKWRTETENFDLYFKIIKDPKTRIPVCMAVRWQDAHLAYWLDSFIEAMSQALSDNSLDEIIERNFREFSGGHAR